jgi:hypothetical protein
MILYNESKHNILAMVGKANKGSPWHNILRFFSWERSLKVHKKIKRHSFICIPTMISIKGVIVVSSLTYTQGAMEGSPLKVF